MSKFKLGSMVQVVNVASVYHMCIGKIVGIIETNSANGNVYRIGEVEGYIVPITVSEKDLVLVCSDYGFVKKDLIDTFYGIERNYVKYEEYNKSMDLLTKRFNRYDDILVPKIKNVILNDPAVIVLWEDGTKTVVKAQGEKFDPEKGLAMAISKKAFGNKHSYYGVFLKNIPGLKKKGAK